MFGVQSYRKKSLTPFKIPRISLRVDVSKSSGIPLLGLELLTVLTYNSSPLY